MRLTKLLIEKTYTKIITDFCLSYYIDLNNTSAKSRISWGAKQYFDGIKLLFLEYSFPLQDESWRVIIFSYLLLRYWQTREIPAKFVLMKTSWGRLTSLSLEDVFKTSSRHLDQDEYIYFSHTSLEELFKRSLRRLHQDGYIDLGDTSSRRLARQDVFKSSFQDVFKTSCKNIFKASSKRLQDVLKRCLQEIFKTFARRITKLHCCC